MLKPNGIKTALLLLPSIVDFGHFKSMTLHPLSFDSSRFLVIYHIHEDGTEFEHPAYAVDRLEIQDWTALEDHQLFTCYKIDEQGNV